MNISKRCSEKTNVFTAFCARQDLHPYHSYFQEPHILQQAAEILPAIFSGQHFYLKVNK